MTPAPRLWEPSAHPSEALRVLAGAESELTARGISWAGQFVGAERQRLRSGTFLGALYSGPKDEAVALASWEVPSEVGRRIWLFFDRGMGTRAVLEGFLDALADQNQAAGPVVSVGFPVAGVDEKAEGAVFLHRGFFRVVRVDLVYPSERSLFEVAGAMEIPVRGLVESDEPQLAKLIRSAYDDNPVERALFVRYRDPDRDAEVSARDLLGGEVGTWLASASFGAFDDGELVGATLGNDLNGPLISEVIVAPSHRRRKVATHLLRRTLQAFRAAGRPPPRLVVTTYNQRAYRLYRSLGFEHVPGADGGYWLDLPALGYLVPTGPQSL